MILTCAYRYDPAAPAYDLVDLALRRCGVRVQDAGLSECENFMELDCETASVAPSLMRTLADLPVQWHRIELRP